MGGVQQPRSKAVEISSNLGAGPVLRSDELAADDSLAVDDGGQVDMMFNDEARIGGTIVVNADGENGEAGLLMMEREKRWHLLNAGSAPRCPEIEQDDLAAVIRQMNCGCAVGDGEVGSRFAGLRGVRTAIARGQNG